MLAMAARSAGGRPEKSWHPRRLCAIAAGFLCYVLVGFVVLPVLIIVHIVLTLQAVLEANKGEGFRYPLALRLLK